MDGPIAFLDSSASTPPADSTLRVGILKAAHNSPVSVTPNDDLKKAITHMMSNDFSQIPVMEGQRKVKGMLTWESIGSKTALGQTGDDVKQYMDTAEIIEGERPLFDAVSVIASGLAPFFVPAGVLDSWVIEPQLWPLGQRSPGRGCPGHCGDVRRCSAGATPLFSPERPPKTRTNFR